MARGDGAGGESVSWRCRVRWQVFVDDGAPSETGRAPALAAAAAAEGESVTALLCVPNLQQLVMGQYNYYYYSKYYYCCCYFSCLCKAQYMPGQADVVM